METMMSLLAIVAGLLLRLAIPIAITALLIVLLHRLDMKWQKEAQTPALVEKPECWKIKGGSPEKCEQCKAATSSQPCWQVFRLPNGYMREECLSCKVFTEAAPALKIEPRRM